MVNSFTKIFLSAALSIQPRQDVKNAWMALTCLVRPKTANAAHYKALNVTLVMEANTATLMEIL